MFPVLRDVYKSKNITFLLCKCKRGDTVRNADHIYKFITHEEYLTSKRNSSKQWYKQTRARKEKGKQYDLYARHAWIDTHNHGVLHFGINPNHLRLENLQFRVFYLTCAVTKRLLSSLKTPILNSPVK